MKQHTTYTDKQIEQLERFLRKSIAALTPSPSSGNVARVRYSATTPTEDASAEP